MALSALRVKTKALAVAIETPCNGSPPPHPLCLCTHFLLILHWLLSYAAPATLVPRTSQTCSHLSCFCPRTFAHALPSVGALSFPPVIHIAPPSPPSRLCSVVTISERPSLTKLYKTSIPPDQYLIPFACFISLHSTSYHLTYLVFTYWTAVQLLSRKLTP